MAKLLWSRAVNPPKCDAGTLAVAAPCDPEVAAIRSVLRTSVLLHSLGALAYVAFSILLALRSEEGRGPSLPLNCAVSLVHGLCFLSFSAALLRRSWLLRWTQISCFIWVLLLILAPWQGHISTNFNSRADLTLSSSLWQEELAAFGLAVMMNAAVISLVPIARIIRFLMIGTFLVSHVVVCGLLAQQAPLAAASRAIVVVGQAVVLVFGAYAESQKTERVHRVAQEAQRIEGEELQKSQDALFQTQAALQAMMEETCTQVLRMRSDFIFGQHVSGDDVLGVGTSPTSLSALDCLPLAQRANLMAAVTKMEQAIGKLEVLQTNLMLPDECLQQEQKAKMLLVQCAQQEPRFLVGVCLEKPKPVSGLTPGSTPVSPQVTAELTAPSSPWQSLAQGLHGSAKQRPANPPMESVQEDAELVVVEAQQEGEGGQSEESSGPRSPLAVVGSQPEGEGRPSDESSGKRSANFGESEGSSSSFQLSSSEGGSPPPSLPGTPLRGNLSVIAGCPSSALLFQSKEFKDVEVITDIVAGDLGRFRCRCCAKPPLPPGALVDSARSQRSQASGGGGSPKMKRRNSFVGRGTPLSSHVRAIAAGSSPGSSDSEDSAGTKPYGRSSSSLSEDSERERRSVFDAFSGTWRVAEGQPEVSPWLACFTICRGEAWDGEGQKTDLEHKDGVCSFVGGVLTRVQGSPVLMRVGRSGRPLMFIQVAAVDEPSQDRVSGPKRRSSTKQSLEQGNMYAVTPGGSS